MSLLNNNKNSNFTQSSQLPCPHQSISSFTPSDELQEISMFTSSSSFNSSQLHSENIQLRNQPSTSSQNLNTIYTTSLIPILIDQHSGLQITLSSPSSHQSRLEATPLPKKVGEIGYVNPNQTVRFVSFSQDSSLNTPIPPTNLDNQSLTSPSSRNSNLSGIAQQNQNYPNLALLTNQNQPAHRLLLKPILLIVFGLIVFAITMLCFFQLQSRSLHTRNNSISNSTMTSDSNDSQATSNPNSGSNLSFAYIGTIFIITFLVEFWLIIEAVRSFRHRLGLWVDQEYPSLPSDLSDSNSVLSPPVLPQWAKILRIKPQPTRPPLLPPYTAVLNLIRSSGRSEHTTGTGDVEDGEVIRNLVIGQGHAAPAFDGEEFRKSTVVMGGPAKRASQTSNVSQYSSPGLIRTLSRRFSTRFTNLRPSSLDHLQSTSENNSILPSILLQPSPLTRQNFLDSYLPRAPSPIHNSNSTSRLRTP
ncbi:hypothetical protein O181_092360 [Austropuccinia psidii MF-1]|uniref:Uncharacterized protein n=1 Tax=Austropuccinia psidii MF-1 TaxID=1389203 RepID=A0A9Q3IYF0_9BASI|nr:hypothetical protein [Austropuccinia psidii MF-1]